MPPESAIKKPPVAFLLTVWGKSYISQFLNGSLLSLLAPGNLPAMAEAYDCSFIFLTDLRDQENFKKHPAYKQLEKYCRISFVDITDLIFGGNYSATVTLAYERGMRRAGTPVCDTYFIYLVSDYIFADGSLKGLMRYMAQGYSGITAGNFQIVEENCRPYFEGKALAGDGVIAIPPRELMAYSLNHLHPMTMANTLTQSFCHSLHSNRLFWRVDEHTLLGRFYLRHMICIRPETDRYIIGASCDYSFIPELCPSGNVAHIGDSDDYLVVEMQPLNHERNFIRFGPLKKEHLPKSLAEWTTADHRKNAHFPIIFHSQDIPPAAGEAIANSEKLINGIEAKLPPPVPARGHPYWVSCVEAVVDNLLLTPNHEDYYRDGVFAGLFGSPAFGSVLDEHQPDYRMLYARRKMPFSSRRRRIWGLLTLFAGNSPHVYPWHRYWTDYRAILPHLEMLLQQEKSCLFTASSRTSLADWAHAHTDKNIHFQKLELMLLREPQALRKELEDTRLAIAVLSDSKIHHLSRLLSRCIELFPGGATVCVVIISENNAMFKHHLAGAMTACLQPRIEKHEINLISSPLRPTLDFRLHRAMHRVFSSRSLINVAWNFMVIGTLGGLFFLNNLLSLLVKNPSRLRPTSALITIRLKPETAATTEKNQASKVRSQREFAVESL